MSDADRPAGNGERGDDSRRPEPEAAAGSRRQRGVMMAVTIQAPPAKVWPWLAQMGCDRGGWYSWDRLDNGGHPSADRIHPEWQRISAGDLWLGTPRGGTGDWTVADFEPGRFLALRSLGDLRGRPLDPAGSRPRRYTDIRWLFTLDGLPGDRTRLETSMRWSVRPRWLQAASFIMVAPVHRIMQARQLKNLKRRAEQTPVKEAAA